MATRLTNGGSQLRSRNAQYLLDVSVLAGAFLFAYLLRFEFEIPPADLGRMSIQLPLVVLLQIAVVRASGIYSFVWKFVGMAEIGVFLRAAGITVVPLLALRFWDLDSLRSLRIPLSIILIDVLLAFGGLLALRVARRAVYERYERERRRARAAESGRGRVILAGAGRAGALAMREIAGRGDLDFEPVGFVDDDVEKVGAVIHGVKVLGVIDDLADLVEKHRVDQVIITMSEVGRDTIQRILQQCERARIPARIIPGLYELLQGSVSITRFREIEIEDLLGRDPVRLDEDAVRDFVTGKSILVTGAGGSIGSELCRQVARHAPSRLILVERSEGALFDIDRKLREFWPALLIESFIADAGDIKQMKRILRHGRPAVLFHAAAHKHVGLSETNVCEAVKSNVLATHRLGRLSGEAGIGAFVMLSTDKAVRPVSIMGATKQVAELIIQRLHLDYPATRYVAVRFGNVMGSTGSVIPIFREQITAGGPVTVTDAEATRYFMTIPEAVQLVLEAGAIGGGGEILVLDMGEPIRILDLASDMIRLSGLRPGADIPIVFTGLRPGERLNEDLDLESVEAKTRHHKILVGRLQEVCPERLDEALTRLEGTVARGAESEARALLKGLLSEADFNGSTDEALAGAEGAADLLTAAGGERAAPTRLRGLPRH